jgi:hypothetical protein
MEKLNYYHRELPPSYRPRLRDRRWEDVLVPAVALAWSLFVLVGVAARVLDGNGPPDSKRAAGKAYREVRAERQMFDGMLLVGGVGCCGIAAGVAHRAWSDPRGWRFGTFALVALCAFVGLLGTVWSAAQLSSGL